MSGEASRKIDYLKNVRMSSEEQSYVLTELADMISAGAGVNGCVDETARYLVDCISEMIESGQLGVEAEGAAFFALGKCHLPASSSRAMDCLTRVISRVRDPFAARNALILIENFLCDDKIRSFLRDRSHLSEIVVHMLKLPSTWMIDRGLFNRVKVLLEEVRKDRQCEK